MTHEQYKQWLPSRTQENARAAFAPAVRAGSVDALKRAYLNCLDDVCEFPCVDEFVEMAIVEDEYRAALAAIDYEDTCRSMERYHPVCRKHLSLEEVQPWNM